MDKGYLNVGHFSRKANDYAKKGWRLAHIFEQNKNTVTIWEKERPPEHVAVLEHRGASL